MSVNKQSLNYFPLTSVLSIEEKEKGHRKLIKLVNVPLI